MEKLIIHEGRVKKGIMVCTGRAMFPFIQEGEEYSILEREETLSILGTRTTENTNVFDKKTGLNRSGYPFDEVIEITARNIDPDGPTQTIAELENNRLNIPDDEFDDSDVLTYSIIGPECK